MISRLRDEQRGASTVVVALCMTVLLVVVALVVDIGATAARKAQLQDAADAAALAVAQLCYEDEATTTIAGCALSVDEATDVANPIADETVFGGIEQTSTAVSFPTDATAPNARETVVVTLTSAQAALFSFDRDATDVLASATAEWRQTVALPLAANSCVVGDPATAPSPAFVGTGLYTGVQDLLTAVAGALGRSFTLPGYLTNIFECGVSVLAGGWLGSASTDCTYDPQLLVSTLSSTLERLLPINQAVPSACSNTITELVGKRIIIPVFEHSTSQTLTQLLGFSGSVSFAEIVVTGYEFDGILGTGLPPKYPTGGPRCAQTLDDLLGISESGLEGLLDGLQKGPVGDILKLPVVSQLAALLGLGTVLNLVTNIISILLNVLTPVTALVDELLKVLLGVLDLCQGVQGHIVSTELTAAEAAERIATPVRLVA